MAKLPLDCLIRGNARHSRNGPARRIEAAINHDWTHRASTVRRRRSTAFRRERPVMTSERAKGFQRMLGGGRLTVGYSVTALRYGGSSASPEGCQRLAGDIVRCNGRWTGTRRSAVFADRVLGNANMLDLSGKSALVTGSVRRYRRRHRPCPGAPGRDRWFVGHPGSGARGPGR